jgi:hypothetical protein
MREKVSDFLNVDLARLNLFGWLLMLASLAIVVGGIVLFVMAADSDQADHSARTPRWAAYLCLVAAALFFFGGRWVLDSLDIGIYRRPPEVKQ